MYILPPIVVEKRAERNDWMRGTKERKKRT